jgi:hypothetical protein
MRSPLSRREDLIVEELDDGLLIYDTRDDRAHSLQSAAASVWQRADGHTPPEKLSEELGLEAGTVDRALAELESCGLLEVASVAAADGGPVAGTTRRELGVRVAKVGGAVAAAPLIVSVAAPTPAAAQTPGPPGPPPEGCEAVFTCLEDCGQTQHGCKGTGCCCCQLPKVTCAEGGVECPPGSGNFFEITGDIKFCASNPGGTPSECASQDGICRDFADPCLCQGSEFLVPCPQA